MSKRQHKHIDELNAGKVKSSFSVSLEDPVKIAKKAQLQPKTSEFLILDFLQTAVLFYQLSRSHEKLFGKPFSYPNEIEEYGLKYSVDRALKIGKRYSVYNPNIIEEFVFCKKVYFNPIIGLEFFELWNSINNDDVGERYVVNHSIEQREDYDSMKQLLLPTILDIFLHCSEIPINQQYIYNSIFHEKTDEIVEYCFDQVVNDKCGIAAVDHFTMMEIYRDELGEGNAMGVGNFLIYVCEMVITGYSDFMQKDARLISSVRCGAQGRNRVDSYGDSESDKSIRNNVFGAFQIALSEQTSLPIPEINSFDDLLKVRNDKRIRSFRKAMYEYLDAIARSDADLIIDIGKKIQEEQKRISNAGFNIIMNRRLSLILGAVLGQIPIISNLISIVPWINYELKDYRKRNSFLFIGQTNI